MLHTLSNIVRFAMRNSGPIPMLLALVVLSLTAPAQTWQVDSRISVARFSVGSGSDMLETGLARVSGQVVLGANAAASPIVRLTISPGDDASPQPVTMNFTSKHSVLTSDGRLITDGDLAVTRVERSMFLDPNESFSGPVYGQPVSRTAVHAVTLTFYLPQQNRSVNPNVRIHGAASVARREFPQLLDAFTQANWPTELVNGRKCTLPLATGEDYAGPKCTGTLIASVSNAEKRVGSGEAFSGFEPAVVPDLDRGSIAMDLTLTELEPAPSSASAATVQRASMGQ